MFTLLCTPIGALQPSILQQSNLAGNVKFDPLRLAEIDLNFRVDRTTTRTPDTILNDYREAELKHARLAMLATVAYPAQETLHPLVSDLFHLPNGLSAETLSPSLINGGLDATTLILFVGFASALELSTLVRSSPLSGGIPGDYGWRVLVDAASSPYDAAFERLQQGEIWNGRLAMLAALGYVVQEAVTGEPVLGFLLA